MGLIWLVYVLIFKTSDDSLATKYVYESQQGRKMAEALATLGVDPMT